METEHEVTSGSHVHWYVHSVTFCMTPLSPHAAAAFFAVVFFAAATGFCIFGGTIDLGAFAAAAGLLQAGVPLATGAS